MSVTSEPAPKKSFLSSAWLKGFAGFVSLLLFLAIVIYANTSRVVVLLDEHLYEETLTICVVVFGWVAPDRQKVELQTFCNVAMFTLAEQSQNELDGAEK